MAELFFMKLDMHIMTSEPISTAYFKKPSHQSVSLYVYPLIVARQRIGKNPPIAARQRLGKNATAATNTHETIKEFLEASFSMRSVSYQGK
jgi:hypothetical protein